MEGFIGKASHPAHAPYLRPVGNCSLVTATPLIESYFLFISNTIQ